ncbi:MAG: hypothetical protein LAT68_07310 [Cyclobacteriaceae bacterium]|nr:hypothetical protein [Cyclobacteriaceae bacterium]MCH8516123.1 hypothetical protein [Cyclobacteriaceae bacterium]
MSFQQLFFRSGLFISIISIFWYAAGLHLSGIDPKAFDQQPGVVLVFFGTWFIYSLHYRLKWFSLFMLLPTFIASILAGFFNGWLYLLLLALGGSISLLYQKEIFGVGNWRKLPYAKIPLVALVWALLFVTPAISMRFSSVELILIKFIGGFAITFAITLIYDCKDISLDRKAKIPVLYDLMPVKIWKRISFFIFLGGVSCVYVLSNIPLFYFLLLQLAFLLVLKRHQFGRNEVFYFLWVDAILLLVALAVLLS